MRAARCLPPYSSAPPGRSIREQRPPKKQCGGDSSLFVLLPSRTFRPCPCLAHRESGSGYTAQRSKRREPHVEGPSLWPPRPLQTPLRVWGSPPAAGPRLEISTLRDTFVESHGFHSFSSVLLLPSGCGCIPKS